MNPRRGKPLAVATRLCPFVVAVAATLSFAVPAALASRNIGGHLYWRPRTDVAPNAIEFHIFYIERLNSPGLVPPPQNVGDIYEDDSKTKNFSFGFPGPGGQLNSADIRFIVRAIEPSENWVLGEILSPGSDDNTAILVNYPNATPRIAQTLNACCIAPYDQLNALRGWRLFSRVVPGGSVAGSPVGSLFPPGIVRLPQAGGPQCFPITVDSPPAGVVRTFRKGDRISGETGSTFYREPPGITIDANSGLVCWDTSTRPLGSAWSFFAYAEDFDATSSAFITSTAFFMEIVVCGGAGSLSFVAPSPTCDGTLVVNPGELLEFSVAAHSSQNAPGGFVTLTASGLPAGASVDPAVAFASPTATSTFSWTPTVADEGLHDVTFTAVDACGNEKQCAYTIRVNRPPDVANAYATIPEDTHSHDLGTVTIHGVTDPEGDEPITLFVNDVRQDEATGPNCPDAVITDGVAQVRNERDGGRDGRVYHVFFTATDSQGGTSNGDAKLCVSLSHELEGQCGDDGPTYASLECEEVLQPMGRTSVELSLKVAGRSESGGTIEYSLPRDGHVQLTVFDLAGRRVATLVNSLQTAGVHRSDWNGAGLARGMYFCRLTTGGRSISRPILALK
jgi:hypothetical protein